MYGCFSPNVMNTSPALTACVLRSKGWPSRTQGSASQLNSLVLICVGLGLRHYIGRTLSAASRTGSWDL